VGASLAVLVLSAGATALMPAAPAQAAPACHPEIFTYHGGGWCDYEYGWGYFGQVQCTDGRWYYGPVKSDQSRSYGYCPSGSYANRVNVTAFRP
jgi:hypothetical protein